MTNEETYRDPAVEPPLVIEADEHARTVPPRRKGGFVALLLGGILAAGAGFGLSRLVPEGWPTAQTTDLRADVTATAARIADLEATVAELSSRPVPDAAVEIEALRSDIEARLAERDDGIDLDAALSSLEARIAALEDRPAGAPGPSAGQGDLDGVRQEIAALRGEVEEGSAVQAAARLDEVIAEAETRLAAMTQELDTLRSEMASTAGEATLGLALGRLQSALDTGEPLGPVLTEIEAIGLTVPPALTEASETGIERLGSLQDRFPDLARDALDAALRADVGTGWADRTLTFLRTQTGARLVEPRAGDDPDAILSRANAAVAAGNLTDALGELDALPDSAKAPLAEWLAEARRRAAADAALSAILSDLGRE